MIPTENTAITNRPRSRFFLFPLKRGGKKRLAYGLTPEEAREIQSYSHTPTEMRMVDWTTWEELKHQREIPLRKDELA